MAAALIMPFAVSAQEAEEQEKEEGYVFTTVKEIPVTSVKDQNNSGTCWCYSGLGFIEAELLRMGKGEYDLSEMYIVHKTYDDRAMAAVRTHGDVSFSQGGSFYDVIYGMKTFGVVPEEVMRPGIMYNDSLADHSELSALTDAMVKAIAKGDHRMLQSNAENEMLWAKAVKAVHDVYLGECPEEFTYNGKKYTPATFYESLGLNSDDYVSLTSYTHHPFYEKFVLEIQDNWRWSQCYNLPLDEFMEVFDNAIDNGYTIAWGSDVSEMGFRLGRKTGACVLPDALNNDGKAGSDQSHWLGLSQEQRKAAYDEAAKHPTAQRWVSQEERQLGFDNWTTTDDHGMLIYGTAKDQMGNEYYMVKNSWGDYNQFHGNFYVSKAFARYKTMNIVVHKDALPKNIKKALGIK